MAGALAEEAQPTKLAELPLAAQKTILAQAAAGQLGEISKSTEDGEVIYEAEMTRQGKTRSFTVNGEGELLEVEVFLPETPRPVQKVIRERVGKGRLLHLSKSTAEGEVTYDVEMSKNERTRHFSLDQDGQVIEFQVFLEETPEAVRKAIEKELPTGRLGESYQMIDDGEVSYDVEISQNGKQRHLS
ncbi:MAG TPA: hypothetical protein VNT26_24545, partial [Candidatus Sulfotelmatobacter sp.]|nr:hypothetical protein [Candidatus Sulfotelmatobacter sp.]